MALCLLGYDLLNLFIQFENISGYYIPIVLSILLTIYGFIHARKLTVKNYDISLPHIKQSMTIALLSDIHIGTLVDHKQLDKIISKVMELNPDYVMLAGDTFDDGAFENKGNAETLNQLKRLTSKFKVCAILGNHDPASQDTKIREFFKKSHIHLLIDDDLNTEHFYLIGRDDISNNPNRKSLDSIINKNIHKPTIVLDHNPAGIQEAMQNNIDLILCGHTHRGQFFPANIFTELAYGKESYYGYAKRGNT